MISFLCKISGVSRSGYYNYFSFRASERRAQFENKDSKLKENILKALKFKKRKKGARQIKMTLQKRFNIIYNLKRIRRIMKKYKIICAIRKANPYKKMLKATQEHSVLPNLLKRKFKQGIPGKALLTDITYLYYGNGHKAYLSTILDSSTNEILAYNVSNRLTFIKEDESCRIQKSSSLCGITFFYRPLQRVQFKLAHNIVLLFFARSSTLIKS